MRFERVSIVRHEQEIPHHPFALTIVVVLEVYTSIEGYYEYYLISNDTICLHTTCKT